MKGHNKRGLDQIGLGLRLATRREETSIGADLGIEPNSGQPVKLTLSDPHGDTIYTITLPANSQTITGIDAYATFDEYGQAETGRAAITTGGLNYGWLGAKHRATDTTGLLLMGARLYNPTTGQFTSRDPIPGSTTTCTYPQDPISSTDLDGMWSWRKFFKKVAIVAGVVGALACGASVVYGVTVGATAGATAYAPANAGTKRFKWKGPAKTTGLGALSGLGFSRMAKGLGHSLARTRGAGIKFSRGGGRGTDLTWKGVRKCGIHSHWIETKSGPKSRALFVHYHRRPGIGKHRPWQGW